MALQDFIEVAIIVFLFNFAQWLEHRCAMAPCRAPGKDGAPQTPTPAVFRASLSAHVGRSRFLVSGWPLPAC